MTRRLKGMDGDDDNSDGGDENATPSPSSRGAATSSNTSTSRTNRPSNPLQDGNVSLLSSFIYSWTYPLLRLGLERPLQETDLFELADVDSSTYNKEYIQRLISNQRQKSSKSSSPSSLLARALLVDYYQTTRFAQLLLAINTAARITQSVALGLLLEQFDRDDDNNTGDDNTNKPGYLWVGLLILCGLLAFPSKQRLFFETYRKGYVLFFLPFFCLFFCFLVFVFCFLLGIFQSHFEKKKGKQKRNKYVLSHILSFLTIYPAILLFNFIHSIICSKNA